MTTKAARSTIPAQLTNAPPLSPGAVNTSSAVWLPEGASNAMNAF